MRLMASRIVSPILLLIYVFSVFFSAASPLSPNIIFRAKQHAASACLASGDSSESESFAVGSRFYELFFGKKSDTPTALMLCPSGEAFGLRIKEDGVTVTDVKWNIGFQKGDRIISAGGEDVCGSEDVESLVRESGGAPIPFRIVRGGETLDLSVTPRLDGGEYKLGIMLRSVASGIGTMTFIDPETGLFGGLGHGVCDSFGAEPLDMQYGSICGVILGSVKRGECGKPGELSGVLDHRALGSIAKNTECGVFGKLDTNSFTPEAAIPVASESEIKLGAAEIISTVRHDTPEHYSIEIFEIDRGSEGSKSFKIRVTDPALIAKTGGIVRGMSGSPIIQDGKLIGAVTHVMVANPTEGYGIFIENMLEAANNQSQQEAA